MQSLNQIVVKTAVRLKHLSGHTLGPIWKYHDYSDGNVIKYDILRSQRAPRNKCAY